MNKNGYNGAKNRPSQLGMVKLAMRRAPLKKKTVKAKVARSG